MSKPAIHNVEFDWSPQPAAAMRFRHLCENFCDQLPFARQLAASMLAETGTRFGDWVDHLVLPALPAAERELREMGFTLYAQDDATLLQHHGGLFPLLAIDANATPGLAIKVESIEAFLASHRLESVPIAGSPMSPLRRATIEQRAGHEFWVVQRQGDPGLEMRELAPGELVEAFEQHRLAFLSRQRYFASDHEGFAHAATLFDQAAKDLGVDRACDLFFQAEREYWQSRNHAARVQKSRQDQLGLGWANHDHHTYRSSRQNFRTLIAVLEQMGFTCRERFYGGRDAGWGAQVLEQPNCGIVIFADVDLAPHEVTGDFAHDGLAPREQLGTVGLWCKLHGEAFLQAGMHHLECQFDFAAARSQLAALGVATMTPFTDFDFLKQAFTVGEIWPVTPQRIAAAFTDGSITREQAERFQADGSLGSHLEILERNNGYKGFNQTGISEIIRETDPRQATAGRPDQ